MGNHAAKQAAQREQKVAHRMQIDAHPQQEAASANVKESSSVNPKGHKKPFEAAPSVGPYALGKKLGAGQFGLVRVGIHSETGCKVAIKKVSKKNLEAEEIRLQRLLEHEHVVKVQDVIEVGDDVYIVMDYVSGGDLFDHLVKHVRLEEAEARRLFQQVIDGVDHCHQRKIVHRDLKAENILLDKDKNIKIADFGFAAEMKPGELLTKSCGSPNYAAPELLYKGCQYKGPEIDVWSCGVVLYALLTNRLPFDADNIPELFSIIKKGRYRVPSHVPADAKDLLARMLTVDPEKRITIAEIRRHTWFAGSVAQERASQIKPKEACEATEGPAEACKIMKPLPSTAKFGKKAEPATVNTNTRRFAIKTAASVVIKLEAALQDMPVRYAMSCAALLNHLGTSAIGLA